MNFKIVFIEWKICNFELKKLKCWLKNIVYNLKIYDIFIGVKMLKFMLWIFIEIIKFFFIFILLYLLFLFKLNIIFVSVYYNELDECILV